MQADACAVADVTFRPPLPLPDAVAPTQHALSQVCLRAEMAGWYCDAQSDQEARAWARSCGGFGAASWLSTTTIPELQLDDPTFLSAVAIRMAARVAKPGMTCPLVAGTGRVCGYTLDPQCHHLLPCPSGGALLRRHNHLRDALATVLQSAPSSQAVYCEQTPHDRPHDRLDLVVHHARGPTWVDVTVVSPVTVTALQAGAADYEGITADRAASGKHRTYHALPQLVGFALEAGGRPAAETAQFLHRIAPPEPAQRSAWLQRAWSLLQVTLQQQQAHLLMEVVAYRTTPPHTNGEHS